MEIGHNEEADGYGDDAEELDMIVGADTVGKIIGNFLIEKYAGATCCEDNKADNECAKVE